MAKIAELKKYLGYEFSSGSYTGEDYKSFQTKYLGCQVLHERMVQPYPHPHGERRTGLPRRLQPPYNA